MTLLMYTFNALRHHPELQFKLMQAIGIGKQMFHPWIALAKKVLKNHLINGIRNSTSNTMTMK